MDINDVKVDTDYLFTHKGGADVEQYVITVKEIVSDPSVPVLFGVEKMARGTDPEGNWGLAFGEELSEITE